MSSKKKSTKEKNVSDEAVKSVKDVLLPSQHAAVATREHLLPYTRYVNMVCGRRVAEGEADTPIEEDGRDDAVWRGLISRERSCASYPFHEISLDCSPLREETEESDASDNMGFAARLVRRIVQAHIRDCHELRANSFVLGSSVYGTPSSDGKERPTVTTFTHVCSRHINVCCGLFYYKLVILEDNGELRSVASLRTALDAIVKDAEAEAGKALSTRNVSESVKSDLQGFERIIANLSKLNVDFEADVMRRLRETSDINCHSLDSLEFGLFTLVLEGAACSWLHSGLSVYIPSSEADGWTATFRVQALLVSAERALQFIHRVVSQAGEPEVASPSPLTAVEEAKKGRTVGEGAEGLLFWLPEKHRVPLWPYPEAAERPAVQSLSVSAGAPLLFPNYLLLLLTATVKCLAADRAPRVCLVAQTSKNTLSSVRLYSKEIEHYLQVLASDSLLITKDVRQVAKQRAIQSVEALVEQFARSCADPRVGREEDALVSSEPADVSVSTVFLTRPYLNFECHCHRKLDCWTDFSAHASLHVTCVVEQEAARGLNGSVVRDTKFSTDNADFEDFANVAEGELSPVM
ncbi:Choline/Carnitine o-acyltransferase, putative [Angomonas deanei]|uniref:Choline/Carnitine o-acyltransferase, putative n=1 Tax=Angomonas deanei TaxID=59799 RepID=A0A7G2CGM3_9TRYP|nr:Choline/Carnitine o-acyltransferase, putative [Angomonas deanei]